MTTLVSLALVCLGKIGLSWCRNLWSSQVCSLFVIPTCPPCFSKLNHVHSAQARLSQIHHWCSALHIAATSISDRVSDWAIVILLNCWPYVTLFQVVSCALILYAVIVASEFFLYPLMVCLPDHRLLIGWANLHSCRPENRCPIQCQTLLHHPVLKLLLQRLIRLLAHGMSSVLFMFYIMISC